MKNHVGKSQLRYLGLILTLSSGVQAATYPAWRENVFYAAGSMVSYNGYDYRALVNQTDYSGTGWTPSVGSIWGLVSLDSGGTPAPSSTPGTSSTPTSSTGSAGGSSSAATGCYAAWNGSAVYTGGNTASYGGKNYRANWWTSGQNPGSNNGPSGSGQPWTQVSSCGGSSSTSSTPPASTPSTPVVSGTGSTPPAGLIFSPYKDITINMDWNTTRMSTAVNGYSQSLLAAMPAALSTVTWAFATGECGQENWGGLAPQAVVAANVQSFVNAGKSYIISTGGASGSFTCSSDSGFSQFIRTYYSAGMKGVDFDIEGGQDQSVIDNLVQRVKTAQRAYPGLRFSFTLATLGGSQSQSLGTYGSMVMQSVRNYGLQNYTINLMVMDYGSASSWNCTLSGNGLCEMGKSAIQAAIDLHNQWGVAYSQIELTPMIGGNDTAGETFTLGDTDMISNFALQNHLAGLHFWSFDRDNDCAPGSSSATCNTWGQAGTLGFTHEFLRDLHLE